jgi:hypothetical protein
MTRSLALVAALLLLPAAASADDRTLREAGRSHDAEFTRLGKRLARLIAPGTTRATDRGRRAA